MHGVNRISFVYQRVKCSQRRLVPSNIAGTYKHIIFLFSNSADNPSICLTTLTHPATRKSYHGAPSSLYGQHLSTNRPRTAYALVLAGSDWSML